MKPAGVLGVIAAIAAVPAAAMVYVLLLLLSVFAGVNVAGCSPDGTQQPASVDVTAVPAGPVAGYGHEQLVNAAYIVNAAQAMKLDSRAQVIGVMTAMGESSLVAIDYGDWEISGVRNPDGTPTSSIGLFQQQTWWGTVAQRMDPTQSAALFFQALIKIPGWESLEPTIAAHRVQGNSNPYHYAKYFTAATTVVAAVTGLPLTTDPAAGVCTVGSDGDYPPATGTPPGPWGGHANGRIPENLLTTIPWDGRIKLRADAAAALVELDRAFLAQFGYHLPLNDGYRTYDEQVDAKRQYGDGAATPGTSNHGWAMAIDVGDQSHWVIGFTHPIYYWLKANGPAYGWVHPPFAEPGGPGPDEAWHWEFYGKAAA